MIILTGYYLQGLTTDDLRNATVRAAYYSRIGARDDDSKWDGRANVPGVAWKMPGAVGCVTDISRREYMFDLKLQGENLSFHLVSVANSGRRTFSLQKSGTEYWGWVRTIGTPEEAPIIVCCNLSTAVGDFIASHGIPNEMLVPPHRSGMH